MTKDWAKFMYANQVTPVEGGDCVHQRHGITHDLFEDSPDMEYLDIVGPADFALVEAAAVAKVHKATPWSA